MSEENQLKVLKNYQDTYIDLKKLIDEEMRILSNSIDWLTIDLEIAIKINHSVEEKYIRNNLEPKLEAYNFYQKLKTRLELWQKNT